MLLLLLACVPHAPSAVTSALAVPMPTLRGAEVRAFDLQGADRIDLLESCLAECPRDEDARPVGWRTRWELRGDWMSGPGGACEVTNATIEAIVTVDVPQWRPSAGTRPELVSAWQRWQAELLLHEQGHADLAHAWARVAESEVRAGSCAEAPERLAEAQARLQAAQDAFDVETGHGRGGRRSFWEGG